MTEPLVTCYRHPDRRAGVSCQRCGRPICPSCMVQASVGFQCPECVRAGARSAPVYSARTLPVTPPLVTYVLIGLNVLVFVAQLATTARGGDLMFGASGRVFEEGVLFGPSVGAGEWWRLLTSGFLHAGLLHVGMNMYVLYILGPQLEKLLGPVRFAVLYVASLFAGSLGVLIVSPFDPTLGASGAIFGLLGAAAAYQLANRINIWQSGLGTLIGINLLITFLARSYISVGGHLGGLVGGAAVGYLMVFLEQRRQPAALGVVAGVTVAVMCGALAVLVAPVGIPVRLLP